MSETPPNSWLPVLETNLSRDEIVEALDNAARRGRLPGFTTCGDGLFRADAYANPFEHAVEARAEAADGVTRLRFRLVVLAKIPVVFAAVLVLSAWPGLPLTDSMLSTYSDWYAQHVETWWWYVPSLVLCVPAVWGMAKKSRAAAGESAREAIGKIAAEIDARVVEG